MLFLATSCVGPVVSVIPRQRHVTNSQTVKLSQRWQRVFDCVSTLDSHQASNLSLFLSPTYVCNGSGKHKIVRIAFNGSIDRIDHVERTTRRTSLCSVMWLDIDREKLCSKSAFLHTRDTGAIRNWWSATKIVVIISHRGRDIVVCIDHNGFTLNLQGSLPEFFIPNRFHITEGSYLVFV